MKPGQAAAFRPALMALALGCAILAAPAAAQPQTQPAAPAILRAPTSGGNTDKPPKFRMYFTVLVIGALMLGANAIPSKRGHQD